MWWVLLFAWSALAGDIFTTVWEGCNNTASGSILGNVSNQQSFFVPSYSSKQTLSLEATPIPFLEPTPVTLRLEWPTGQSSERTEGSYRYMLFGNDGGATGPPCGGWGSGAIYEEIVTFKVTIPAQNTTLSWNLQFTSVNTRPKCYNFSVYVRSENCPSGFSTVGVPPAISALSADYGRCTVRFNDTSYCGPRYDWWTDSLVANGRGQVAWNSYWTFPVDNTNNQGVWTNLGVGLGFGMSSLAAQPASRVQVIDLIALGHTAQFLDTNPNFWFIARLQENPSGINGANNNYFYQLRFSNTSTFASVFSVTQPPTPFVVSGPLTINLTGPTTGGTLRFVEIKEFASDTKATNGPFLLSTAFHLNLNECILSGNNGGCVNRLCVDQLAAQPQCGACLAGFENVNATHCQRQDPCLQPSPCGPNANCSSGQLPDRNKNCTCWTGYTNSSGNCTDFNECGATNGNCSAGTCFNVIGAPISTPICLPVGQNCSLAFGGGGRSCNVTLPDNAANHNITFLLTGVLPGTLTLNASTMSFGPVGDPKRFACASASITGNMVQCIPPAGVFGTNLSLTLSVCSSAVGQCWELSFRNAGVFNHPNPQINASSIRFWGGGASAGITAPSNVGGDLVVFGGLNLVSSAFGALPSYKVQYRASTTVYACTIQNTTAMNQTVCITSPGAGANFRFEILIDNVVVATGTDTFSYPTTPAIVSVTGCPNNTATTTSGCPTSSGSTVLTITGTNFVSGGFVVVGGANCQPMNFTNASYITCVLPPGVGLNLPVIVASGTFLSLPSPAVSFASPVITNVSGCPTPAVGGGTADCARGGTTITITGNNFGAANPIVYLGSSSGPQCTNVSMIVPHTQITCTLPPVPLNSDSLSVVVQQFNGQVSLLPAPTVLYLKCPAGAANDVVTCDACTAGKYSGPGETCQNCIGGSVPDKSSAATSCTTCLAGTAAAPGASVCGPCSTGRYAPEDGAAACANCPQGRFATSPVACDYCMPGTYQPTNETSCLNCTSGKYASYYGSTICTQCQPGKYSNVEQAVTCTTCIPGFVQSLSEQQACVACPVGRQANTRGQSACDSCVRGRFAASNATAECELCMAGFFQSDTGETTCEACPPGTQAPQGGSSLCTSCPSGTFGVYDALNGTANCTPCRAGFAQPAASQSLCEECGAGKYSAQAAATCVPCQAGSYSASAGASACSQCPLGAKPDPKLADCLCPIGTFSEPLANSSQISCSDCPAGAVCTAPGVTLANLLTAPGWWRALGTLRFYPCRFPELCLGGLGNVCEFAREGALCSVCIAGYSSNGAGKPCTVCPPQNAAWGETVGIMLLILAIIILLMVCMLAYSNMQQRALIALTKANDVKALADMQATLKEYEVGDDYFEQVRRANQQGEDETYDEDEPENTEDAPPLPTSDPLHLPPVVPHTPHAEFQEGGWLANFRSTYKATLKKANVVGLLDAFVLQSTQQLKNKLRRAPNFIYKVKILLGFFQVATIMPLNGIVNWPLYWTRFISAFSFFNFDFIPWSSLSCATAISYLDKALIIGCVPIAAVLLIAVVVYVWDKSTYKYNVETQLEVQMHQRQVWRQFTKLVLFTVFLLYPFSSKVTLGVYNCVTVEGQTYVAADFTLNCSDAYYTRTAGINAIFVLLYPIGVPVTCFYILYRQLHRLREPEVVLQFGFLYDAYTDDRWYWEFFDMTHKLCLTSITLFLPAKAVMPTNMCIIVLYFIGLVLANPYIRKGDDRFHLLVQVNLYLLALIGLILVTIDHPYQTELADEETMVTLLSCLLIFMNLGLFIGFFIIAGRNALKIIRSNQRAKKANVEPLPAQAAAQQQT